MIDDDQLEMLITVGAFVLFVGLFIACTIRMRRPVDPRRPRILPYTGLSIFLGLAILLSVAHTISVYTGHRLEAKNKMRGQH